MIARNLAVGIGGPGLKASASVVAGILPRNVTPTLQSPTEFRAVSLTEKPQCSACRQYPALASLLDEHTRWTLQAGQRALGTEDGVELDATPATPSSALSILKSWYADVSLPLFQEKHASPQITSKASTANTGGQLQTLQRAAVVSSRAVGTAHSGETSQVNDQQTVGPDLDSMWLSEFRSNAQRKKQSRRQREKVQKAGVQQSVKELRAQRRTQGIRSISVAQHYQQRAAIQAWAAESVRARQESAHQKQLRKTQADHQKRLVLRTWAAAMAQSRMEAAHQKQLDDIIATFAAELETLRQKEQQHEQQAVVNSMEQCPDTLFLQPPGLSGTFGADFTVPTFDIGATLDADKLSDSLCRCNDADALGCSSHGVYTKALLLAQRELGLMIAPGPPGLERQFESEAGSSTRGLRIMELEPQPYTPPQRVRKQRPRAESSSRSARSGHATLRRSCSHVERQRLS